MVRVVDRAKWRRAKALASFLCWLGAVVCAGGLEGDATTPVPSVAGFITFISASALLTFNILRENDR